VTSDGLASNYQGDLGEMWLHAAAAAARLLHSPPGTQDLQKADVQLTLVGEHLGEINPTVLVQVKTTTKLREVSEEELAYDLDVETYNLLRKTNHRVRRVLLVVNVPEDESWAHQDERGLVLHGRAVWASLEDLPESFNKETQVVYLPKANSLDEEGLVRMLKTYGVTRSTPVPDVNTWEDSL
jgi:uncharacterized protein DUF4365